LEIRCGNWYNRGNSKVHGERREREKVKTDTHRKFQTSMSVGLPKTDNTRICLIMVTRRWFLCLTESKSNRVSPQDHTRSVSDTVSYWHARNAVSEAQDDCSYQENVSEWNSSWCV